MLIKRNTEPKNKEFFNRVVPIIPYVVAAGIIFQIISAITEAFGINQFGSALGAHWLINIAFTLAVVIGWEFLIRVCVRYVFKTTTLRLRGEIKMERFEFLLISLALLLGVPAIYYSFSVSKENAHMTFEVMMPDRDTTVLANIDSGKASDLSAINTTYQDRKAEIEKRYKEKDQAAKGVYLAAQSKHNTNIQDWKDKEKRYNKKYPTYINQEKDKINKAYEVYKSEAKNIVDAKAAELKNLDKWRDGREDNTIALAGDSADEANQKRQAFTAWFRRSSNIWKHFAGLSVVFAVLCVMFSEVFKVLAGIEEETHLTPESLDPGIWNEFVYLVQLKVQSPIRNKIRTAINKTASKRVDLEIVTPSTISVTPERYAPPSVTGTARTVTHPLRSTSVTPVTHKPKSVTESVTEMRYTPGFETPKHPLPTHVTPVTGETVTHFKGSAVPKPETVTRSEAVTIELDPTVTAKKPKKAKKLVTDSAPKIYMVAPTKAVIEGKDGERETVTLEQVGSRKRSNYGNVKKRKTKAAKARCKEMGDFYADLESRMKEAN